MKDINREEDNKEEDQLKLKRHMYSVRDRMYYFFNAPVIIFLYNVVCTILFIRPNPNNSSN